MALARGLVLQRPMNHVFVLQNGEVLQQAVFEFTCQQTGCVSGSAAKWRFILQQRNRFAARFDEVVMAVEKAPSGLIVAFGKARRFRAYWPKVTGGRRCQVSGFRCQAKMAFWSFDRLVLKCTFQNLTGARGFLSFELGGRRRRFHKSLVDRDLRISEF